jgi:hypothetical protein
VSEVQIITQHDYKKGEQWPALGPCYSASQRIVEEALAHLTADDARKIADGIAKQVYERIYEVAEDALWSDAEVNLQGKMWRMVDEVVRGILSGERWVMVRYALGSRYDCDKIREAVAKHIPQEIMQARIADLEADNERLRRDLDFARGRY